MSCFRFVRFVLFINIKGGVLEERCKSQFDNKINDAEQWHIKHQLTFAFDMYS